MAWNMLLLMKTLHGGMAGVSKAMMPKLDG
jgi:hypothetical protein